MPLPRVGAAGWCRVEHELQPGQVVVQEGSTGRELYLILSGLVEVVKGEGEEEMVLAHRGPGDVIGEMSFLEARPRFATVRAMEPTSLLELPEAAMHTLLAEQPHLLYRLVTMLSARMRTNDLQMIADLHSKNAELSQAYHELKAAQAALVEKERLERELELARELQLSILPGRLPEFPGICCAARAWPARYVGGDFYDVIPWRAAVSAWSWPTCRARACRPPCSWPSPAALSVPKPAAARRPARCF